MKNLLIMAYESPGLYNDALIYESVLEKYFNVKILMPKDVFDGVQMLKQNISDVYFFLEMIFDVNIYDPDYKNKTIIFMPNQELFRDGFKLEIIDIVLCKTLIAKDMFDSLKKTYDYTYNTFYTKFTTYIPEDIREYPIVKDENLFISFAGKSPFKNIDVLVNMWIKNNGFIHIDPNIKLIITCYGHCLVQFMKSIVVYFKIKFVKLTNNVFRYKNLVLYDIKLESDEYKKNITSANCAICVSRKEGYGHYINESRYFNTCVLTVDAQPMNELVINKKNGLLVDVEKNNSVNNYNYQLFDVYPQYNDFKNKIIELIKNKKNLSNYGEAGRKMYEEDKKYYYDAMEKIVIPYINETIAQKQVQNKNYAIKYELHANIDNKKNYEKLWYEKLLMQVKNDYKMYKPVNKYFFNKESKRILRDGKHIKIVISNNEFKIEHDYRMVDTHNRIPSARNFIENTLKYVKTNNLDSIDGEYIMRFSDSCDFNINIPSISYVKPKNVKGFLFPDFNMHKLEEKKATFNEKCKNIHKKNQIYFKGNDTSKNKTQIREKLEPLSDDILSVDLFTDKKPYYNICEYKYVLDIPGNYPWSVRLIELYMSGSLPLRINFYNTEVKNNKTYKYEQWIQFYELMFPENESYINFVYEQNNSDVMSDEVVNKIKNDLIETFNYYNEHPELSDAIIKKNSEKIDDFSLEHIYYYIYQMLSHYKKLIV